MVRERRAVGEDRDLDTAFGGVLALPRFALPRAGSTRIGSKEDVRARRFRLAFAAGTKVEPMLMPNVEGFLAAGAGAPSIDVDFTLFFQAALFIGLWIFLTGRLFKPYLRARKERESLTEGAREEAAVLRARATEILTGYEAQLAAARGAATAARESLVKDGRDSADQALKSAREASAKELEGSRSLLESELSGARKSVEPRAKELSNVIAERLLA